jgi:hypothetical protein
VDGWQQRVQDLALWGKGGGGGVSGKKAAHVCTSRQGEEAG